MLQRFATCRIGSPEMISATTAILVSAGYGRPDGTTYLVSSQTISKAPKRVSLPHQIDSAFRSACMALAA